MTHYIYRAEVYQPHIFRAALDLLSILLAVAAANSLFASCLACLGLSRTSFLASIVRVHRRVCAVSTLCYA